VTNIVECAIVNELLSIAVATRAKDLTAKNHTEKTLRSNPCQVFTDGKRISLVCAVAGRRRRSQSQCQGFDFDDSGILTFSRFGFEVCNRVPADTCSLSFRGSLNAFCQGGSACTQSTNMSLIETTAHLSQTFDLQVSLDSYLSRHCIGGELEGRRASAGAT
jgi:hypothetical protein